MLSFLNLTTTEIIAIVVVALLLFGSRLPGIARSVGKSIVEFKKGVKDVQEEINEASTDKPRKELEDKSASVDSKKATEKSKETANS